jgi:16S rRNA (guanine527-N7)-methyltransferase
MGAAEIRRRLSRRLRRVGLDAGPDVVDGLVVYYELLRRWNARINLTALPDGDEAIDRLLVEPLVAARFLPEAIETLLDVGSGGGSPAIPMKLSVPAVRLWMVESKVRKCAFLREVVRELSLEEAYVETHRFEELVGLPEFTETIDVVTIRAVRPDVRTLAAAQGFLRIGGEVFLFARTGAGGRLMLPPRMRLEWEETLLPTLQSSLVRLSKTEPMFHVEHG